MSDHDTTNGDVVDSMVRGMVAAMSDSGERSVPMATTDAEEVIKAQLTENTGRHLLDSGGAYGRNWEENQDNPPWEQPTYTVNESWVTTNVFDYLSDTCGRDETAVALETALYAYAYSDERRRDAWLTCMEGFADAFVNAEFHRPALSTLGVPDTAIESVLGLQAEHRDDRRSESHALTHNTYNGEYPTLSQVLQGVSLGGPYAEYAIIQVHGGCDIRGGYTAPRVFNTYDGWIPMEGSYCCNECGWSQPESCAAYNEDGQMVFVRSRDFDETWWDTSDDAEGVSRYAFESALDSDHTAGAIFHDPENCGGGVLYHY